MIPANSIGTIAAGDRPSHEAYEGNPRARRMKASEQHVAVRFGICAESPELRVCSHLMGALYIFLASYSIIRALVARPAKEKAGRNPADVEA